jgi:hypothetical protein
MYWHNSLPVLIEPVVNLGLGVEGITEVGWSGGGNPELLLISAEDVVNQLLILSLVVFLDDTEVSEGGGYRYRLKFVHLVSVATIKKC